MRHSTVILGWSSRSTASPLRVLAHALAGHLIETWLRGNSVNEEFDGWTTFETEHSGPGVPADSRQPGHIPDMSRGDALSLVPAIVCREAVNDYSMAYSSTRIWFDTDALAGGNWLVAMATEMSPSWHTLSVWA